MIRSAARAALWLALASGCAGAPLVEVEILSDDGGSSGDERVNDPAAHGATAESAPEPSAPEPRRVSVPGSRLSLVLPPGVRRVPHSTHYVGAGLHIQVADATVAPGTERATAEAYLAEVRQRVGGDSRVRLSSLGGYEAVELSVRSEAERLRVLTVFHEGSLSRLLVRARAADAAAAERVLDSTRFDPATAIDPRAALQLFADEVEGAPLVAISNEQLILRENGDAIAFPSAQVALDVVYVAFGPRPPQRDLERGQLLGARFRGLPIEAPLLTATDGDALPGFTLVAHATVEGTPLLVYGAYLEAGDGAFLVRASVGSDRGEVWQPRFDAFVRSLRIAADAEPGAPDAEARAPSTAP